MTKGAYVSADSPYRNYFDFHNQAAWPYNNSYDGWWGHDTLPKLNYEGSQELMDYVLHVAKNGYLRLIMWTAGDWMWRQT